MSTDLLIDRGPPLVAIDKVRWLGRGLARPECVFLDREGRLTCSDWRGGITVIDGAGHQSTLLGRSGGLRPNGICGDGRGGTLIAHLGDEEGGVFRLTPTGEEEPVVTEIDGLPLPPTNFVHRDRAGRLWITVSTRHRPRALACRQDVADGFIALLPAEGPARIVADGLTYANECFVMGDRLLVNETFGRRLTEFTILADGNLGGRRTVAEFGAGEFPDGVVSAPGGGWLVTSIISNRVLHVLPDGRITLILEDPDRNHTEAVERAFLSGRLGRSHLDHNPAAHLRNVSSLCLGGPEGRTAYLGCLLGDRLAVVDLPVAWEQAAR